MAKQRKREDRFLQELLAFLGGNREDEKQRRDRDLVDDFGDPIEFAGGVHSPAMPGLNTTMLGRSMKKAGERPSGRALNEGRKAFLWLRERLEKERDRVENPEVKQFLQEEAENLKGVIERAEEVLVKVYGENEER